MTFLKDGKNQATYSAISASSSGSGDWYWIGLQEDTIGAWVSFLSPYDSYDMRLYASNHMAHIIKFVHDNSHYFL